MWKLEFRVKMDAIRRILSCIRVQVGGQMGGDNFDCGKFYQKLYGGRKIFLLNTGGKILFSITFPRQVFKVFHVETFLGGGK